ncbi:MAG: T9SS type A sorting domain-containing protein [Bacteroidia bacterium]
MRIFILLAILVLGNIGITSAQVFVFTDNFDLPAGGETQNNAGQNWLLNQNSSGVNGWFIETTFGSTCGTGNSLFVAEDDGFIFDQSYNTSITSESWAISPIISTIGFSNLDFSFDWLGIGEGSFTLYDYGRLLLSADGGLTWNEYNFDFTNTTSCENFVIELGAEYENIPEFRFAFKWRNDGSIGTFPGFNIDNIAIYSEPITILPIDGQVFCAGGNFEVNTVLTGTYEPGNTFTVLLSDQFGNFTAPTEIGFSSGTSLSSITFNLPDNLIASGTYFIRVISSTPAYQSAPVGPLNIETPVFDLLTSGGSTNLCNGPVTISTAISILELEWSTGAVLVPQITVNNPGLVYANGRNAIGCLAISDTIEVIETVPIVLTTTPESPIQFCGIPITVTVAPGFDVFNWSDGSSSNTYLVDEMPASPISLVATDTNGCVLDPYFVDVEFISDINIPISPENPAICGGNPVVLDAAPGFQNYVWSNGATGSSTEIAFEGFYFVVAVDPGGCFANSDTIEVTQGQYPIANFSYAQSPGSYTITFTNTTQNGVDFEWIIDTLGGQNEENPVFSFPENGPYSVTLVASNGCGVDSITKLVFVSFVGLEDLNSASQLNIGPNPVAEQLFLYNMNETFTLKSTTIYDLQGKILLFVENNLPINGTVTLNLESLQSGLYFIEVQTDRGVFNSRFIKK